MTTHRRRAFDDQQIQDWKLSSARWYLEHRTEGDKIEWVS
jgi:hypothetical protein